VYLLGCQLLIGHIELPEEELLDQETHEQGLDAELEQSDSSKDRGADSSKDRGPVEDDALDLSFDLGDLEARDLFFLEMDVLEPSDLGADVDPDAAPPSIAIPLAGLWHLYGIVGPTHDSGSRSLFEGAMRISEEGQMDYLPAFDEEHPLLNQALSRDLEEPRLFRVDLFGVPLRGALDPESGLGLLTRADDELPNYFLILMRQDPEAQPPEFFPPHNIFNIWITSRSGVSESGRFIEEEFIPNQPLLERERFSSRDGALPDRMVAPSISWPNRFQLSSEEQEEDRILSPLSPVEAALGALRIQAGEQMTTVGLSLLWRIPEFQRRLRSGEFYCLGFTNLMSSIGFIEQRLSLRDGIFEDLDGGEQRGFLEFNEQGFSLEGIQLFSHPSGCKLYPLPSQTAFLALPLKEDPEEAYMGWGLGACIHLSEIEEE